MLGTQLTTSRFYFLIKFFVILISVLVILQLLHSKSNYNSEMGKEESENLSNFILKIMKSSEIPERQNIHISIQKPNNPEENKPVLKPLSTYLDLAENNSFCLAEKHSLCAHRKFVDLEPPEYYDCPKSGIVTVVQGGRLGNQIWEYISVWLVAKKTSLKPYVPKCIKQTISKLFDNLNIPEYDDICFCPLEQKVEVTEGSPPWLYNHSIILPIYVVEPELLAENIDDIIKVFTIKEKLLDESQNILYSGLSFLNISAGSIFIGVHIRRTDYPSYLKRKYKLVPDVLNFIREAMAYYVQKYSNIIFILVSDDPKWCWDNFHNESNVYVTGKHHKSYPELDLALMASCNHSIIDYGTFGEWGALLAGGETIFYPISDKYCSERIAVTLKNWHTLN